MSMASDQRILRDFVNGESSWESLRDVGAKLDFDDGILRIEETADAPVYAPPVSEVANGFIVHWASGTSLQSWARVLLATGMIDLINVEDHPDGELLFDAIWDAAEAAEIDERHLEVIRRLAE